MPQKFKLAPLVKSDAPAVQELDAIAPSMCPPQELVATREARRLPALGAMILPEIGYDFHYPRTAFSHIFERASGVHAS